MSMSHEQAIYHRALRCRPGDADRYKHVHLALAGAVSIQDELDFIEKHCQPKAKTRLTLFSRLINAMGWKRG